jgi:outer membrane biogenesis lipoprotein LolB
MYYGNHYVPGFFGILLLLSVVLLSACSLSSMSVNSPSSTSASMPDPAAGEAFILDGRFSLTLSKEGSAKSPRKLFGRLFWRHEADRDEWLFSDPLGQGVARLIRHSDGGFTLQQGEKEAFIENGEEALQAKIGFSLPLAELALWARARTGPGAIVEHDALGRLKRARESGWLLKYRYADDADRLPSQLEASLEEFRLKLVIENWGRP